MSKYELSPSGIDRYFDIAYKAMFNTKGQHKNNDNFFREKYNVNDYHSILKTYTGTQEEIDLQGKKLWEKRLHHVCTVLKICAKELSGTGDIELGIFGSNNISSDIDIGVSYKKHTDIHKKNLLKLSDVVKIFEDYFIRLGYTSLDLDVEMYADYFISPTNGKPYIQMNKHMYSRSLPFVVAGLIKNHMYGYYGRNKKCDDIRRNIKGFTGNGKYCSGINIEKVVNNFDINYMPFLNGLTSNNKRYMRDLLDDCRDVLPIAKHIITDYVTMPYENGRDKYYDLLDVVHDLFLEYFKSKNEYTLSILHTNISHALVYRAESYLSAPTIYHVVYTLQSKQSNKNIHGLIGNYGYRLSIIEQFGYLSRYYYQYCNKKCNNKGYNKKYKKYMGRLVDAMDRSGKGLTFKRRIRKNKTRKVRS